MFHLAPLITDLALILISAGVFTLLFKKLKQPLVLGYIVAGFVVGPHLGFTPIVLDTESIQTWSDIGVIFLLFALGLDFSFKKILKTGGSAIIAVCTIIFCMVLLGIAVGYFFDWKRTDCLFLGGMLAMSSTTIIYKAFEDLGLRQNKFAGIVLSILVLEDILAIVLMVMLSTVAIRSNFKGTELLISIGKLVFFLILWIVVGIYLLPSFFRRFKNIMSEETLLIVTLGLCFGMVYFATHAGFSPAFGAFIMGSILSETLESEKIERLVQPVKNLFGAIFFVSVGMMVDPSLLVQYAVPIIVITFAVIIGQSLFGTFGVLLSGQPLKTAIQCGFSLTQIGEFAFIIASLGVSLKVTSSFLYPIVVAVSVITTFITPYMIKLAVPLYNKLEKKLPISWISFFDRYSSGSQTVNHENSWKKLIVDIVRMILIYSIITIAVIALSFEFIVPMLRHTLPTAWGSLVGVFITLLLASPFLRSIMIKKNHSDEFQSLWNDKNVNRGPLVSLIILKVVYAMLFVMYIISTLLNASIGVAFGVTIIASFIMVYSRRLKNQSIRIEKKFLKNFNFKEKQQEYIGKTKPSYARVLMSRDIHLTDCELPAESCWAGKTLSELNLGKKYGVHVASILRGEIRINIPNGKERLYPNDKLQVIGTDEQLIFFGNEMNQALKDEMNPALIEKSEMKLKQLIIDKDSSLLGKSIRESAIRNKYKCLIVALDREGESLITPDINEPLKEGDIMWVVGESQNLHQLVEK